MSDHPISTETPEASASSKHVRPPHERRVRRGLVGSLILAPLVLAAAGFSLAKTGASQAAPLAPVTIALLTAARDIAAQGKIAEIYGNKFIIQDATGRALVETGPRGEDGSSMQVGETVTVRGHFDHGFLHAALITHADGSQLRLEPLGKPGAPAGLAWMKDKVGLGPTLDRPSMITALERVGYSNVRVIGNGPRHLDVAAKDAAGHDHTLHVDVDGSIVER